MTLAEILARWPDRFYRQTWYEGEAFLDREAEEIQGPPSRVVASSAVGTGHDLPSAATLALCYVRHPDHPIWHRYLWTDDVDGQGQRVYVGDNGKGLEIHRHIHISERFGVPCWG